MERAYEMYEEALIPFSTRGGTPYFCTQADIEFHALGYLPDRTGPFKYQRDATAEIVEHNSLRRSPGRSEVRAIQRLQHIISWVDAHNNFSPDLAIKMFRDLDRVFFCGRLSGSVAMRWAPYFPGALGRRTYGRTTSEPGTPGIAMIQLSAETIILKTRNIRERLEHMFKTLLHEMCVSDPSCRLVATKRKSHMQYSTPIELYVLLSLVI